MTGTDKLQRLSLMLAALGSLALGVPSAYASKKSSKTKNNDETVASIVDVTVGEEPSRIAHAKELLGSKLKKNLVKKAEKVENLEPFILELTKKFLVKSQKKHAKAISKAIVTEARKYGFDPLFVMAVIQNESSFNTRMKGAVGEIGLMQVRPTTAKWIADSYHIKFKGDDTLYDPSVNIQLGVALMDKLRDQFDAHSRLYISAYNIGATKVRSMVEEDRTPREYVVAVMKRYLAIYQAFGKSSLTDQIDLAYESVMKLTRQNVSNN